MANHGNAFSIDFGTQAWMASRARLKPHDRSNGAPAVVVALVIEKGMRAIGKVLSRSVLNSPL